MAPRKYSGYRSASLMKGVEQPICKIIMVLLNSSPHFPLHFATVQLYLSHCRQQYLFANRAHSIRFSFYVEKECEEIEFFSWLHASYVNRALVVRFGNPRLHSTKTCRRKYLWGTDKGDLIDTTNTESQRKCWKDSLAALDNGNRYICTSEFSRKCREARGGGRKEA